MHAKYAWLRTGPPSQGCLRRTWVYIYKRGQKSSSPSSLNYKKEGRRNHMLSGLLLTDWGTGYCINRLFLQVHYKLTHSLYLLSKIATWRTLEEIRSLYLTDEITTSSSMYVYWQHIVYTPSKITSNRFDLSHHQQAFSCHSHLPCTTSTPPLAAWPTPCVVLMWQPYHHESSTWELTSKIKVREYKYSVFNETIGWDYEYFVV